MTETGSVSPDRRLTEDRGGTAYGVPLQQAVVDQATGWLAGRLDCSISEAGGHLARLARENESSMAEAAALVLGDATTTAMRATAVLDITVPARAVPAQTPPVQTLRVQQAILPTRRREFRLGRYDIAVRYQPAHSGNGVGGDWYEVRPDANGDVIVGIGDVAGHELSAAAGMARIGNALRGLTATGEPAHKVLGWLNDLVCADEAPEQVASAALGSLGAESPALRWAQAGHPPPVLVRNGEPRLLLRPSGLLLGTMSSAQYELTTENLAAGDILVFYTDGLIERRDRDIDEGLIALLRAAAGSRHETAAETVAGLADCLESGSEDDICILAIRVL
ncbi:MAG TPA: SpoIIE family protein phosphatase [Trebonia sp.]|nr:SpoIIE family protein phosphatase [Trebonia sp.]